MGAGSRVDWKQIYKRRNGQSAASYYYVPLWLATEFCGQFVNKKTARGTCWRKHVRDIGNFEIVYLLNAQKLSCKYTTTELIRNDVCLYKQLALHADWLRHRSTPFVIMKMKILIFLSNAPRIVPSDAEWCRMAILIYALGKIQKRLTRKQHRGHKNWFWCIMLHRKHAAYAPRIRSIYASVNTPYKVMPDM